MSIITPTWISFGTDVDGFGLVSEAKVLWMPIIAKQSNINNLCRDLPRFNLIPSIFKI
jgi:hypothetical protein